MWQNPVSSYRAAMARQGCAGMQWAQNGQKPPQAETRIFFSLGTQWAPCTPAPHFFIFWARGNAP